MALISPASDQTYTIADAAKSWTVATLTTQVPACGYSQTITPTSYPTFVTAAVSVSTIYY